VSEGRTWSVGTCSSDLGLICVGPDEGPFRCLAPKPVGEPCDGNFECGPGFVRCDPASHRCATLPSTGPCVPDSSGCNLAEAWCDRAASPPTCVPSRLRGESCSATEKCGINDVCTDGVCVEAGRVAIAVTVCTP